MVWSPCSQQLRDSRDPAGAGFRRRTIRAVFYEYKNQDAKADIARRRPASILLFRPLS